MLPPKSPNPSKPVFLVTMALPYANGDIHLGHLVEAVQTDVFVRFQKLRGNKAVFVCADDTHGTPIELSALKKGIPATELIDAVWKNHVADYAGFEIGFDNYYSTNSPENRHFANRIFEGLKENGLIKEKEIEQFFCEHDKRFLPDRFIVGTCPKCGAIDQYGDVCESCGATYDPAELKDRLCMLCRKPPVARKSTHLFVDLVQCEGFLREYLNTGVLQQDMLNFVSTWIEQGLKQWCISRDGPYFGFEIPGYPGKFFYVWLDAPIGYIASTDKWCKDHGEKNDDYWAQGSPVQVVHFIGKDIVYFHTLFWPVMLKNSGFNLPSKFFIHGFLTVQGEKMSKTRGTFIRARDFLDKVNHPQAAQFLRFYFASKLSNHAGDIDLNIEEFCNRSNTTLANNVGNLHNRTFVFIERYFGGTVPDAPWDESIEKSVNEAAEEIVRAYAAVDYKGVVEKIHALGSIGNKYYQDTKPWELMKSAPADAAKVMTTCANVAKALAVFLKPIVPGLARAVEAQFGFELTWDSYRFSLRNTPVGKASILAQPLETSLFDSLMGKAPSVEIAAARTAPSGNKPAKPAAAVAGDDGLIGIEQFKNVDLRVATVVSAERVEKSNKLLRLQVEIGGKPRQIVAGIAEHYDPAKLIGTQVVVVANLKPAKLMGQTSEGMLLAAKSGKMLVLVRPETAIDSGATVS